MHEIHTELQINAPAERVWQILTNFEAFADWNPFIRSVEGNTTPGERLTVRLQSPGGKGMTFKPKVLKAEPQREFRWLGHLLIPGLFDGEHYFIIEQLSNEQVNFVQGERFSGVLVPVLRIMGLLKDTALAFEELNRALKTRAEEGSQS